MPPASLPQPPSSRQHGVIPTRPLVERSLSEALNRVVSFERCSLYIQGRIAANDMNAYVLTAPLFHSLHLYDHPVPWSIIGTFIDGCRPLPTIQSRAPHIKPPQGWTDRESSLCRKSMWDSETGLKWSLERYYGLKDATPIWVHLLRYSEGLFIFEASQDTAEKSYFLWNAVSFLSFGIELKTLEEIGRAITELGSPEGYIDGLTQLVDLNRKFD